jgi:hypothetical protein
MKAALAKFNRLARVTSINSEDLFMMDLNGFANGRVCDLVDFTRELLQKEPDSRRRKVERGRE